MTVIEIVKKYLQENGYDGLANKDCGCGIDNIAPCGSICHDCNVAKKIVKDKSCIGHCDLSDECPGYCYRSIK